MTGTIGIEDLIRTVSDVVEEAVAEAHQVIVAHTRMTGREARGKKSHTRKRDQVEEDHRRAAAVDQSPTIPGLLLHL